MKYVLKNPLVIKPASEHNLLVINHSKINKSQGYFMPRFVLDAVCIYGIYSPQKKKGDTMLVKARKVGNSFALTIPAPIVETMNIYDGLEMKVDYNPYNGILTYQPESIREINWEEFVPKDGIDIRDGLTPEEYVRRLRDYDRGDYPNRAC